VWTADPSSQRLDLTVPLAQCGTGIGQVLAILYVAVLSTSSQILIIDEPQSFLHPGAIRKPTQVLKSYSKHQYIVATHSPTVVSGAEATTITVCRLEEGVSTLARIDPNDAKDLRSYLFEVGARLADVFGADNILWVEGRTEEICFPMILEKIGNKRLGGVALLGVSNTGELQTRDAERVFDLYNRLSERNSLLRPAIAFIIDSECRTPGEKVELQHRSRGLLKFLPRRVYENYLLNPKAISAVVGGIEGFRAVRVTEAEVEALIQEMEQALYACPSTADLAADGWRTSVDAAKILEKVFNQLSECRVAFSKVDLAVLLTEWLLENAPKDLKDVSDLIASCL
jgi:AAA domain, putative AbiEii toxin, Type IV TA system